MQNIKDCKIRHYNWIGILLLFVVLLAACKKGKDNKPEFPADSNENINTWILDSLKRYYYWNESLPSNPNISLNPRDFFRSVKNTADRFSYMNIPNDPSTGIQGNISFGFDYTVVQEQSTSQVIGIIKMVLNESPASRAGLRRGDYIRSINGTLLTESNAASLQQEMIRNDHFSLGIAEFTDKIWTIKHTANVTIGVTLDQQPTSKIITYEGKNIAYLYFQDFNPGLISSLSSDFSGFKDAGVSDMILDLRYNSGGQVAEAAGLCALISKGVTYNKPFITYKGNKNGGTRTESIGSAATFDGTIQFETLLQNNLGLNRIFILGTGATASAAELIINNLKPYLQVTLIGEKTLGKDEASFSIVDFRHPKQVQWELHPIVYKLFNALGAGNYSTGITPDLAVNELSSLPLYPIGDVADPLIHLAMSRIIGKTLVIAKTMKNPDKSKIATGKVFLDTRTQAAQKSMLITHR